MRKLIIFSLALLTLGCAKEFEDNGSGDISVDGTTPLSVSLPAKSVTKTYLGDRTQDSFPLLWTEGDKVSLNGSISSPVSAEDAGKRAGTFTFRGSIKAPFNLLYPGTEETDIVTFPAQQNYRTDTFDPAGMPMYASSESYTDASLRHLGTLLCFPFKAPEGETATLKHLIIMSIDGHNISGSFNMAKDDKGMFTGKITPKDGVTTATLAFPEEGLTISDETAHAWISLPAGNYPKGFTALVVDVNDRAMMMNFMTKEESSDDLAPGHAVIFPTVTFSPGEGIFIIDEPEDLVKLSSEPTDHPEVLMVTSIDMSGVEAWTPIDGFNGLFNGAGHSIKGLNNTVFKTLNGEIRNLNVEAAIKSSGTMISAIANEISSEGKVASCSVTGSIEYTGKQTAAIVIGPIAGKNHGEITSSSSEVTLTIPSETECGPAYIGGFAGQSDGKLSKLTANCTIDCAGKIGMSFCGLIAGYLKTADTIELDGLESSENAMLNLTYPSSATPPLLRFGGLFGYVTTSAITIRNCTNRADIEITIPEGCSKSTVLAGGIVGNIESNSSAHLISCVNNGNITITGNGTIGNGNVTTRQNCMAGIVGKCQINNATNSTLLAFKDCVNNGHIDVVSHKLNQITYIAGICGDINAWETEDIGCINNGNLSMSGYADRSSMGGHFGILWPATNQTTKLTITGKGETPVNTGTMTFYDKENESCHRHPVAGGVIGRMMANSTPIEFNISNCTNNGMIDRSTAPSAKFKIDAGYEACAGGIIGNIGYLSTVDTYGKITGTVENCHNNAQITINAYAGDKTVIETTTSQSFLGGIIGLSHAKNGLITVKDCSNTGYMRLSAGNAGGIVGRIQSNTVVTGTKAAGGVTYTLNSGRVGEVGLNETSSYVGTGYSISGGIVGALIYKNDPSDVSKIEYCHNEGDISACHRKSASSGAVTRPTAGGIIGQYDHGRSYAAVRYCKNSGHVRSYRAASSSSTHVYSGLISGSSMCNLIDDPKATEKKLAIVRDCAVGGFSSRAGGWIVPTEEDGEYPFYNYIYCYLNLGDEYPPTTEDGNGYAEGCVVWDGISKLSWEE